MTRSDARAFYTGRLQATYYDLGVARGGPTGSADVTFYADVIRPLGRRVLELGAGTGRVAIALAELGFEVTGLDASGPMLDVARSKLADLAPEVQARVRLVHGDMATTRVGGGFDAVVIPARSFCFLLTPETQRACLALIREQLRPGGVLALQVFDPLLDLCASGAGTERTDERLIPGTDERLRVEVTGHTNDPLHQVMREAWTFTRLDRVGEVLERQTETLTRRWTYRVEMRHLLELAGFEDLTEYSDFDRSSPAYGAEQVWIARRPEQGRRP